MYKILVLSFVGVFGISVGQILQDEQCNPDIPLMQDFNINDFLGTWHEIRITETEFGGDCSTIEFQSDNAAINVVHKTVRENFYQEYQGQASVPANTARLTLNLPTISNTPIDFWVLNTDYSSFALTYGCENVGTTQRRVYLWQLGRETAFPNLWISANLNTLMINLLGISNADLRDVSHGEEACFQLPVISPGQPVILSGRCNQNINGVANFDASKFLGVWHQIQSYYSNNALGSCNRAQYTDGGDRVNVVNSQVINKALNTIQGYATVVGNDNRGHLNVVLEVEGGMTVDSELLILGTDYDQWAVTYTCNDLPDDRRQVFSWVVSRTRQLPPAVQLQVNQVINSLVELNNQYYQTTDQSDASCFYIPQAVPNEPVVFGGQCDSTIPVVPNFDPVKYMGLWHDIERYPTPFQFGTCNNAFYTLGDAGVDVFNTQVLDEKLLTINGLAVPVDNGKLVVSFPVEDSNTFTETDYWILSTDYTSYSLVYSCRNINDYQQQVTVWKLGRSKQLPSQAQDQINAVISTLDILDQTFFKSTDQSVEGCFYYPDPQPGKPVEFPGTCETNIPVVADFDLVRFQGEWFEVEAYPKDPQEGQCINHRFTAGTGSAALNFASSYVEDQLLGSTNGQLTFYAGQTGGRFTLSFVSNGITISFPYYVIATDYTDYALVYSCVNIPDSDFRGIWAWKLSRSKQLSSNGITQINTAIANGPTVVLSNDYFEPIDQSDDACFYFPDLAPGEPVILPGQCANLPVIQNFNPSRYLGDWRVIENYPSDNQNGQCNRATYTEGIDGRVLVYNNEVVSQTLQEINGYATLAGNLNEGKLSVTFPGTTEPSELWILDTDYTSYSFVYSCANVNNQQRRIQSWKLSRTSSLTPDAVAAINAVISNVQVLNGRYYQNVDQSDAACFYYPIPGSGPTIFRGKCDESIPVVTEFNAVGYMGLWHDIESYAMPFQDGTCPNAFYNLDQQLGRVEVFNTQVFSNQTLDSITGFAELVPSNDNSAKLLVTFPTLELDEPTPYWVLSTDYLSYAFVYSCVNIGDERRAVTSWKLSRTKTLSPNAANIINGIVSSNPVLDDRYYIARDQSRDGCFYFPEPQPGVPVKFPGECEANIAVVENFDLNRFQGEWFEVEAYPKDPQEGQCINHRFTAGTGSAALNFASSYVDDQLLGSTNGQLTFYAGQTGGRFTLSFVSNGITISFPYYVIATDYTDYALVYSCVNIPDSDFRGIWAWKLSRSKQLSSNGITQINTAIANSPTVVLSNDYFEPIDQSDDACFYFPDLAPGEPVILPGQCANLPVIQNFNPSRYLGDWRVIENYPSDNQNGQCNRATYTEGIDGRVLIYNNEVVSQTLQEINGYATLAGNLNEGKLSVTFPGTTEPSELWILDTDYTSYSFVYSCVNVNNQQRRIQSWKLSRTSSLTPDAVAAINAVISNVQVLNSRYYQNVDQSDAACFYYPIPGSGPTIFRGKCDESIPVVTEFNAVGYMGLWHDIESYAMPFQDGTCPNAFYNLDQQLGRVEVFNTQVLSNQTLDSITGFAELVPSNDNSAKLLVTFPTQELDKPTPYWVLSTDYISYAFVYSCVNIGDERRAVTSWKLSRTKTLSPNAANIINGIVSSNPVLDDRYYIARDQSRDGCFYFPEPQPGVPVKFPGQCDANIAVVQDFNLNRFSGVWHEIETYPKEEQTGQCINHAFTISESSNTLDMKSYNVIAQSLGVTDGSLRFTFNDNTARMTITFTSDGTVIEIPYWIIDTDYENYALAYSCVNIDDDFRGIWSWKLSRSKQLRQEDSVAINNAIANIDVLGNQYYEEVDQTDEACFFYPDTAPGEQVVFPGKCADIPAMPNFNATAYLGLWRTIESYPSDFQRGTCGDATYSLGDGVVVVFNTEVVNGALSTIYGTAEPATDGTGKLYVTFPDAPFPVEYLVLDTDYETYSLVYSCVDSANSDERTVYSWKLGRDNTLPPAAVTAIDNIVDSIDVLVDRYYEVIDRSPSGCFYFPEPSDAPVRFRGQCDTNIPVQPNFNAAEYTGIWYIIESYPAAFQVGTCGTASYTLDQAAGVVLVENTQVLNEVLDIQTGIARVVDNAKLEVVFEVNGVTVTTDYWILATDYNSYSLVYSCQNIDSEYKQVNSWKLSKTKTLPPAAVPVINNVINNVQVLEQRYFVSEDQSEKGCFFYPDNKGGDVILNGQCLPDNQVLAVPNFNTNLFSGIWHEVARFPSDLQNGACAAANFLPGTQNSVLITNTIVKDELQSSGTITTSLAAGRGVFDTSNVGEVPFDALYVLSTDYVEYALIYGCRNLENNLKQIYSWKLARSRAGLSPAANTVLDKLVSDNIDLFENYYSNTEQSNDACFHYPEFEQNEAIVLPGPCDDRIRGVANFNAASYTGLWLEIEKYQQANQFGTCDRAYYTPGDGNVLVRNTQVVDDSLLVQLGTAEVASTDGTGLLNVNFNVNGVDVSANYYIIATDYTHYALVYSCRNTIVNNEEKSIVSSWKLSRTTSLDGQSQAAINTAIEQTRGLRQGYYQPTSQTDEDCFYIPEVDPNSAPLFRGRCEAVTGVANFDVNRYVGWWHELERYPVDSNIGQCISSQYSASGNAFQVVDTSVSNGVADILTGTATVTNDGRITKVLSNGVVEEIIVLSTDYDNYALLYSCVDVIHNGEDYRRVWSAKHSKSRQLSSVNVEPIDQIIASSNVLNSQFYQEVDQSNQACFHYPEVEGQRVILPGQCDTNIPVVVNFDVAAYGGTWYQIERYPQVHENQASTCIGARYVLTDDVVNVLNWEVIDGELETIEGSAVLSSEDGSAKLAVTLPVVGTNDNVTTSLYVLATDYESYSLVYSCNNVNDFQRSIGAWKLSRDRTLSASGNTAINAVISIREELDARYFRSVVQNQECIEPSSSGTLVKSSIVIMLVCALMQLLY